MLRKTHALAVLLFASETMLASDSTRRVPPTTGMSACRAALPPGEVTVEAVQCVLPITGMGSTERDQRCWVRVPRGAAPGGTWAGPASVPDVEREPLFLWIGFPARRLAAGRPMAETFLAPSLVSFLAALIGHRPSNPPVRSRSRLAIADGSLSRRARGLRQKRVEFGGEGAGGDVGVPGLTPMDHSLRRMRSGFSSPRRSLPMLSL